jgi:hypothetical protein
MAGQKGSTRMTWSIVSRVTPRRLTSAKIFNWITVYIGPMESSDGARQRDPAVCAKRCLCQLYRSAIDITDLSVAGRGAL